MYLQQKTIEELVILINEKTEYRKGFEIINFFNLLGFKDSYGQEFPSRHIYTREKLKLINGKVEIDQCIKNLFSPVNFVGRLNILAELISDFNKYLAFDGYEAQISGKEVVFVRPKPININIKSQNTVNSEDDFLKMEFGELNLVKLGLESNIENVINTRMNEIQKSISAEMPLSCIFLCGSVLEGLLLGIALKKPKEFNSAISAPSDKTTNQTKPFQNWSLSDLINVSAELGFLQEDVKKYSHTLREFRNYIHPYQQNLSNFNPSLHTAKISWQVL